MNGISRRLQGFPHFLYFLPLFFVFHNYVLNLASVTVKDAAELLAEYLLISGVLFFLCFLLYRRGIKAALFAFALLSFHLFFGAIHDALKAVSLNFFLARYSVLLAVSFFSFLLFVIYLKKTKNEFRRIALFLNLLFPVLLLTDLPAFLTKKQDSPALTALQFCSDCDKPDIFLLIADEYPDSLSLSQSFGFNNGSFQDSLRGRGFFLPENSIANYNFTAYSVAALFDMNYVGNIKGVKTNREDLNICYSKINENAFLTFLQKSGYEIRNNSIFNLANKATQARQHYILIGKDLVASQTFTKRVQKDLAYHLITTLKLGFVAEQYIYYTKRCNDKLLSLFGAEMERKPERPRFVYTHLLMPHFPYYFDQNGKSRPPSRLTDEDMYNKKAFADYLQYSNNIYLKMIDDILRNSSRPPIILFLGDHGFRWFDADLSKGSNLSYRIMNAVYLPRKNYQKFYSGMSLVNQFRVLLNTSFRQNLPLVKDTSYFIYE
jgi:hypothetical protein